MNISRLPGFTAEAALYPTAGGYHTVAVPATMGPAAVASLMGPTGTRDDCIPGCICVTPEGCPCCDTVPQPPVRRRMYGDPQVIDCLPGSEAACISLCDDAGGGMLSNPDGTISCVKY